MQNKSILTFILGVFLFGCAPNPFVTSEKNERLAKIIADHDRKNLVIQKPKSFVIESLLGNPKVAEAKLDLENLSNERDTIEAEASPLVTASSDVGVAGLDDESMTAGRIELSVSKDADINKIKEDRLEALIYQKSIRINEVIKASNEHIYKLLTASLNYQSAKLKLNVIDKGVADYEEIKGLIDASRKVGLMSNGQFLKIQEQLNEVQLVRSRIDLEHAAADITLKKKLKDNYLAGKSLLKRSLKTITETKPRRAINSYAVNALKSAPLIAEINLKVEEKSSKWNGSFNANATAIKEGDNRIFAGFRFAKPVYDGGRSKARQETLKNQVLKANLQLERLEEEVALSYLQLKQGQTSFFEQNQRLEKKVEFLEKVKVDLDVRQSAGKAQLRELAQVIVDIATTKLELINLEAQKTQATIDFLLLTQNLHSTLLDDEELKEILKIENGN